jgi:excisionase family DNA binding protein
MPNDTNLSPAPAGMTPNELAKLLRVSADKVRHWIITGELLAVNVAGTRCGRPRYVVLPHHLEQWERSRQAAPPPKPPRRKRRPVLVDYFPD